MAGAGVGVGAGAGADASASASVAPRMSRPRTPVELRDLAPVARVQGITRSRSVSFGAGMRTMFAPTPAPAIQCTEFTRSIWPPWSRAGGNSADDASLLCPGDRAVFFVIDVMSMTHSAPRAQLLNLACMFSALGGECAEHGLRVRTVIRYPAAWFDARALERAIASHEDAVKSAKEALNMRRNDLADYRARLNKRHDDAAAAADITESTMAEAVRDADESLVQQNAQLEEAQLRLNELIRLLEYSLPHVNILQAHAHRNATERIFDWGALVYEITQEHTRVLEMPYTEFFFAFDAVGEPELARELYAAMSRYTRKLWWLRDFRDLVSTQANLARDAANAKLNCSRAFASVLRAPKAAKSGSHGKQRATRTRSAGTASTGASARAHPARGTRRGIAPRA